MTFQPDYSCQYCESLFFDVDISVLHFMESVDSICSKWLTWSQSHCCGSFNTSMQSLSDKPMACGEEELLGVLSSVRLMCYQRKAGDWFLVLPRTSCLKSLTSVDFIWFRWRCIAHRIWTFTSSCVHGSRNTFQKLDLFPSSGKGGGETPTQLGHLERVILFLYFRMMK
jgi:hypothetical protein